jgi:hypothetical protein
MLTGIGLQRHAAVTPSQESERVTAACSARLCYRTVALCSQAYALTAFCTSSASSS